MHLNNLFHIRENIVSDNFINDIIEDGETKLFENAKLSGGDLKNRSSKVSWINDKKFQTPLSQFVQSAQRSGGDINGVIAGWSSEST